MKKEIRLNAFAMNCVAHQSPGLWTHPRDRTTEYNRLPYWIDLAQTLERGRFDGLFLADVLGVYDVFGGGPEAALRNAAQTPANDPLLVIPAMAAVTKNLGFGVTSNLSYEPPYTFARRMSTLDHLTEGRIGWNVVTGYLDSAARGAGKDSRPRMMTVTTSPTNIWRWSTSSGKEAGRTTPHRAIVPAASSPILPRFIASRTRETTIGSTPFI
jgi:alkanesulfonate monooxygenase